MKARRMLAGFLAAALALALLSGCAGIQARRFKPFQPPEAPAWTAAPAPPAIAAGIGSEAGKVTYTPEAHNSLQKYIVDLQTTIEANRIKAEGYRKNAEFLVGVLNGLLGGEP